MPSSETLTNVFLFQRKTQKDGTAIEFLLNNNIIEINILRLWQYKKCQSSTTEYEN